MKKIVKTSVFMGGLIALMAGTAFAAKNLSESNSAMEKTFVDAKEIIEQVELYIGKTVETEGKIVHVCGVDKKKMRLYLEDVGSIKIVSEDPNAEFDYELNQKDIRVVGVVKEIRLEKSRIDEMERDLALLCSIDKEPCISSSGAERARNEGVLEERSQRHIAGLRETLEQTGKDYISVITIVAKTVEQKP
ncbi:MAG: hypothetical protein FWG79_01875 [Bacteroidales bacterium]|nr:hypothetical protein [Bacteroidales bacterium]